MLHKGSQSLLICGLVLALGVLTACSSPEAVQANAQVMSSGVSSTDLNSVASSSSSGIVSSSASSVSSAVSVNSEVTSSPSSGTNSTSNQAPSTSKPSGGTVSTKPASTKPASTKPASTVTKPASTAPKPASKPTPTAPTTTAINAKYYGATYGAEDASQYKQILSYAEAIISSSTYKSNYSGDEAYKDQFESLCGVAYSEESAKAVAIIGCFQNSAASGSHGNAYIAYTQGASNCGDDAKAIQAALHVNGINCKLVWGKNARGQSHMWIMANINGSWLQWGTSTFSSGTPKGYTAYGSGYNY